MQLQFVHHIAIICSNYEISKAFYTDILGFSIKNEVYRKDRDSYKLDLALNNQYIIELFSFPNPPKRLSKPEAAGLRHIAFGVNNLEESLQYLDSKNITHEDVRIDPFTNKKFTFFNDPDNLPIELYEI
ncbi:VOC family protein [Mesoflavibacter sp. SCSIO 43206]|uniref:SMU1112c/YaeR family gloxylase I-like metalloprotein n=1 Tax=Mesoflavibacter sp. SCSIO 43206 TaxID=2779362 RepID=UPI00351CC554|nr:VOC family protein [Mesoflavibacter sp. SCSIO 43206]